MSRYLIPLRSERGYALLGIAVLLTFAGLLSGLGLSLFKDTGEHRFRGQTVEYISEVRKTLFVYAKVTGTLPYADSVDGDGLGDLGRLKGELPFISLGVRPVDEWGRRLGYEVHPGLVTDRDATCANLMAGIDAGLMVWDEEAGYDAAVNPTPPPVANPMPVAAVIVSSGPKDADGLNGVFDAIPAKGDNVAGNPYLRHRPDSTYDDVTTYLGATNPLDTGANTLRNWLMVNDANYDWETCSLP